MAIRKNRLMAQRAESRRELAAVRSAEYERAYYARENEEFKASRIEREKPKSSLDRPLSRLPENQLVWVPYVREGNLNYRGGFYATRKDVKAANKLAGETHYTYWEK